MPRNDATPKPHRAHVVQAVDDPEDSKPCPHVDRIRKVEPCSARCEDCVRVGDPWLQLRMCAECGYVGCCDSSKNKHANRHFRTTQHPLARSIEPGEAWGWCYLCQLWFESLLRSEPA